MLGVGGVLAEAIGDVAFRLVPLTDARRRRADRRSRAPRRCSGAFRGEPAVDRDALVATLLGLSQARGRADPTSRASTSTRSSSSTARRSRSTRSSSSRPPAPAVGLEPARTPADAGFARCSSRAGVIVAGRVEPSRASSASSRCTTSSRPGYAGKVARDEPRGRHRCSASTPSPTIDELPDGAVGPRVRVHAGRREPRPAAARARGAASAPRSSRARATARRATTAGRPSGRSSRSPTSSASCSPAPTARASCRRRRACARRSSRPYPPRRPDRDREPVGQLRVVVRELGGADRRRGEPRGQRRQRGRGRRSPTISTGTPTTPRPRSSLAYVEGVADGRALFERLRRGRPRRKPVVLRQGRHDRRRPTRRRQPHRQRSRPTTACSTACAARPASPARDHDRGGVRGRGDVRDPTAARGPAHRGGHDRGRMGSRDRRRDHARGDLELARAARRPARRDRREAPAALEPQQPDRPRRRRDPRHDPRGARARRAPSRTIDAIVYLGLGIQSNQAAPDARRAASIPITGSSGSSRTTSARTRASRRRRPTSPTRPASRSSPRPSSRSPTPTTPGPRPSARPGGSATRPRTAP